MRASGVRNTRATSALAGSRSVECGGVPADDRDDVVAALAPRVVEPAEQVDRVRVDADLFHRLAHCGLFRRLAGVDATAGERDLRRVRPQARGAFGQHDVRPVFEAPDEEQHGGAPEVVGDRGRWEGSRVGVRDGREACPRLCARRRPVGRRSVHGGTLPDFSASGVDLLRPVRRLGERRHDGARLQRRSQMGKYVLAYTGGSMAETTAEQEAVMKAWMGWFGELGSAVIDGGNPFGPSTAVKSDGSTAATAAGLTGYSVIEADSLELAAKLAKGCPVLTSGGSVEVYETIAM